MSSDRLKKLTGKNPRDFEPVAFDVINKPDIELFKELVEIGRASCRERV